MFAATDTPECPWYVVPSNDQRRARLNCISHFLSLIPYEEVPREPVKFPKRQAKGNYVEPDYPYRYVPETILNRRQKMSAEQIDKQMNWYTMTPEEVAKQLQVDPAKGLSAAEAQQRLQKYGPNKLADKKKESGWQAFLRQYRDFMQIILLGAAVINHGLHRRMGHDDRAGRPDGLQRGVGPARRIQGRGQPGGAGRDDEEHRPRAPRRRRRIEIDAEQLVPGDIVLMEAGNRRPGRWPSVCDRHPRDRGSRPDRRERRLAQGHRGHRQSPMCPWATATTWPS